MGPAADILGKYEYRLLDPWSRYGATKFVSAPLQKGYVARIVQKWPDEQAVPFDMLLDVRQKRRPDT